MNDITDFGKFTDIMWISLPTVTSLINFQNLKASVSLFTVSLFTEHTQTQQNQNIV